MNDQINYNLIQWVIGSITVIILGVMFAFTIVGGIAFNRSQQGSAKSFGLLFQRGNFLRIATAFLVVIAVVYLALLNKLSDGAIGILSGVGGYVLGGLDKGKAGDVPEA